MNYIIDYKPYIETNIDTQYLNSIEEKIKNKESLSNEEVNYLLNIIIYITRHKINPNLDNYDYKCDLAQSILYYYFKNLNCNINALTTQETITDSITGHSFITLELIVNNETKYYLLDPTYIQFFKKSKCTKENYFISPKFPDYILLTPDPGFFIQEEMKENAIFLLNHGFIELSEKAAQMYGNSFFNTKTGKRINNIQYQSIPGYVYINSFLKGKTKLSKTEEELINENMHIKPFKDLIENTKKR